MITLISKTKKILAGLALLAAASAQGAALMSFSITGNELSITLHQSITFTASQAVYGGSVGVGIEGAFSTAAAESYITASSSGTMTLSEGGRLLETVSANGFAGGFVAETMGQLEPFDLVFGFSFNSSEDPLLIEDGTLVTLSAGTYTFLGASGVARLPDFVVTNAYLMDINLDIVSDSQAVTTMAIPEPSAFAMLAGFSALGLVALRRRRS